VAFDWFINRTAKSLEAQFSLSKQLANKTVYRVYDLVVYGNIIAGGTVSRRACTRVKSLKRSFTL
jgi:23S rRNA-/tRNA-specific pseudouridylate synthase